MVREFGGKVVDLRTLYGFRLLLKKRVAEYKRTIGEAACELQSMQILWNVLDPESKRIATHDQLDAKTYKVLCDHIDLRYKITFGHLDYKSTSKDDPMGLALVAAAREADHPREADGGDGNFGLAAASASTMGKGVEEDYGLDAVGKGKGKGNGKCHTCDGEGHFARDCPSIPPIGPQSQECHGCGGRGHVQRACPTANPHLKVGKGAGASGGKGSWGKGAGGGKGSWGKGSWGKGGGKRKRLGKRQGQKWQGERGSVWTRPNGRLGRRQSMGRR